MLNMDEVDNDQRYITLSQFLNVLFLPLRSGNNHRKCVLQATERLQNNIPLND